MPSWFEKSIPEQQPGLKCTFKHREVAESLRDDDINLLWDIA
jgi:hypothetical protein